MSKSVLKDSNKSHVVEDFVEEELKYGYQLSYTVKRPGKNPGDPVQSVRYTSRLIFPPKAYKRLYSVVPADEPVDDSLKTPKEYKEDKLREFISNCKQRRAENTSVLVRISLSVN
jgi:hypothetical protein